MARCRILPASYLLLSALLLSGLLSAHAASFDCQKASGAIEQAICASPAYGSLDESISDRYQQLMDASTLSAQVALRTDQRGWLKQRNACAADLPSLSQCLQQQLSARNDELGQQLMQAQRTLDAVIATIPGAPAQAAAALKQYHSALPAAWLLYLNQFEPASGVSRQEALKAQNSADAALSKSDDFAWSLLQDARKEAGSRSESVLLLLRMTIEQQNYRQPGVDGKDREYVHCFIFARQGEAAYQAFGPLYGSTRDGFAPVCAPQGGLFRQEAWQQLRGQLEVPEQRIGANAGTMRYASFAAWRILELRATTTPRDFLTATGDDADEPAPTLRIREWSDEKHWPGTQRQQAIAAIAPAKAATARWLELERAFTADDAKTAADRIVRAWLDQHLDYLAENSDGD